MDSRLEHVVLVDQHGRDLGTMEKMAAHKEGRLHRAFSIFVFNDDDQLLLQQRAFDKYHSAGLWANTCCSHQRPGEDTLTAAKRRLEEEMGLDCTLEEIFTFSYRAEFENGLIENEYDHILIGYSSDLPRINTAEVADFRYRSLKDISAAMETHPDRYTVWFKELFESVNDFMENRPLR